MSVDWSQFRDGDKVRVVFEGVWRTNDTEGAGYRYLATGGHNMHLRSALYPATSAELIERPSTPPPAGKVFVAPGDVLGMSLGAKGYRILRTPEGDPVCLDFPWRGTAPEWEADIEVVDV